MRILGPCRSARTPTWRPWARARLRTASTRRRCSSGSPWEKLMRTTSTPAWMMPSNALGSSVAGPSVATILVLRNIDVSLHVRARYPQAVLSLLVVWRRFRRRLALRALFHDRDCGQFFTFLFFLF